MLCTHLFVDAFNALQKMRAMTLNIQKWPIIVSFMRLVMTELMGLLVY
jgi:hypothetical protein